jgi:hypothetical protein
MVGNYGYPFTYGDNLTEEQARKSLKEVLIGTMVIVSLYLVTTQAANAVDKKVLRPGKLPAPAPSADKGIFDRIAATVYSSCANGQIYNKGYTSSVCYSDCYKLFRCLSREFKTGSKCYVTLTLQRKLILQMDRV